MCLLFTRSYPKLWVTGSLFSEDEIGIDRSIQQHVCSKDIVNTPPVFKGQCIMAPCVLVVSMLERVVGGQR